MPWSTRFAPPIKLPNGRKLVTLKDAGNYITKLPKAEHAAPEWQAAMEAPILVSTHGGPTMFARIGVMKALNRHHVREFDPKHKEPHWVGASSRGINKNGFGLHYHGHKGADVRPLF